MSNANNPNNNGNGLFPEPIHSVVSKEELLLAKTLEVEADGRPTSLADCALKSAMGKPQRNLCFIDQDLFKQYREKIKELDQLEDELLSECLAPPTDVKKKKSRATQRSVKALRPYTILPDGTTKFLMPTETFWYTFYIVGGSDAAVTKSKKYQEKCRRRFRMPHAEFLVLLQEVHSHTDLFGRWKRKDAVGSPCSPISLLLLGSLRYIGRGLTFDDLEEYTAINEETHRQFFHKLIEYGESTLYPKHVKYPTNAEEYSYHQPEFNTGALNGAGWLTDATNVIMWRCSHNLKQAHMGFKQSHPARTFNVTSNHRRYILHSTKGHCCRWNDKTLAYHDEFMKGIHEGKILQDVVFSLFYRNPASSLIAEQKYRGAWGLVDNGCHKWACTQAPAKVILLLNEARLSEWIESFRKDAECTFGILKGRWRILQTGIRLHGAEAADCIWLTCCALHNRLLEVDGLSTPWTGEWGQNDVNEVRRSAPFAMRRLNDQEIRNFGSREHEMTSNETPHYTIGNRNASDEDDEENVHQEVDIPGAMRVDENGAIFINSLSYDNFRARLVEHFDIQRHRRLVKWPVREETA